ncbi:MAG: right-handed parallel beta-helix repeat-containing protein [Clostridia bacterium]|nr:right-handed parallel beta-helix repeat-containing protein [Clostridia bacterium]
MKKVLSIFMAIAMFVTMFSFSTVVFAEEITEPEAKPVLNKYLGTEKNYGLKFDRTLKEVVVDETHGNLSKPWHFDVLKPETEVKVGTVNTTVGTAIIDKINEYAASGEYSAVNLNIKADTTALPFEGLKGTAETPIVIVTESASVGNKKIEGTNEAPAISVVDCEYVTVKNITVTSLSNGIVVEGCKNVTVENVTFSEVGFTDYIKPVPVLGEDGKPTYNEDGSAIETFLEMDTTALSAKGSAVYVGTGCDGVTVSGCSFTKCRAGVVADSSALEEGEVASTGVEVIDCTFSEISDVAVVVNAADDVVVSGGTVAKSGTLAEAVNYDGTIAAAFMVVDAANVTIEKVWSTDNHALIYAENATGRVRYNVSVRDGYSKVDAAELLIYNNTFVDATSLDLTAKASNNIFWMLMGEKVAVSEGDNNCYYWTSKGDRGSIRKNPRFAYAFDGTVEGTSIRDNYIIASSSPCLGKGVKAEDDMGATDFYGNAATDSINIGADAFGAGAESEIEFASDFVDFFNYIFAVIKNFFENLFA